MGADRSPAAAFQQPVDRRSGDSQLRGRARAERIDPCWLDRADAQARFPEAVFDGPVLWDSDAGAVLADDALRALRAGLDVREGVRVDDPRDLDTDLVVVCAGAWTGPLTGLPLVPRIEQVTYFAGAPDSRPSVIDLGDDGTAHYGLVAPGVGYKVALDHARPGEWDPDRPDRPVDPAVVGRLVEYVRRRFPGLDPAPVRSESCLYTMSPDGDYILDVVDGVVVCGGDSGHAFKTGPALGRLAADLAQGRPLPPEADRFRADRLRRP